MKRLILALVGFAGASGLHAQISDSEAEAMVSLINIHTREAIARLVSVNCKDSVFFWKLYDEYQEKTAKTEKCRILLYEKAALTYGKMNPMVADSLAHRYFDYRLAQEKTLQEYYEKIKTATNAVTAFEFYQAEVFMTARVRVNIKDATAVYAGYRMAGWRN